MCNQKFILVAIVALASGSVFGNAQEQQEPVDSATHAPQNRATPAKLVAATLAPFRRELLPTIVPPDALKEAQQRASDLNGDGVIDAVDANLLQKTYGACTRGQHCPGDLNGDGMVDQSDLAILSQNLGVGVNRHSTQARMVGYVLPAPAGLMPPLPKPAQTDGSRVVKLELHSADAKGLRVQFRRFGSASGLELRIYDPVRATVVGPYTSFNHAQDGTWWSPTIFGDTLGIELTLRPGAPEPKELPELSAVDHQFLDPVDNNSPVDQELSCHNDVMCFASWANAEARAVAKLLFVSGASSFVCSGSLINRGPGDFSPLFMTANHCISTQAEADSIDFIWFFNTDKCNGTPTSGVHNLGSLLLKRHTSSDETLLGLYEPPKTDFYVGSDPNSWASGDSATGIHHPGGTFKRISFGSSAGSTDANSFCDPRGPILCFCEGGHCIAVDTWNVNYTNGAVEGGSSGSPIFDSNRRLRGTLTGGPDTCPNATAGYGRFDRAYANLRYYIGNSDVPATVIVNGALAGDSGNAGNTERGTATNPFNTVHEATFCVRSGNEIQVAPGHYNESMIIWRPITIRRHGNSGAVSIGAP